MFISQSFLYLEPTINSSPSLIQRTTPDATLVNVKVFVLHIYFTLIVTIPKSRSASEKKTVKNHDISLS